MLPGELGQYRERFHGSLFYPGWVFSLAAGTVEGSAGVFTLGVVLWIGSTGVCVRGIFFSVVPLF